MKKTNISTFRVISLTIMLLPILLMAQQQSNTPNLIRTGTYHGISEPVSEMQVVSEKEFQEMVLESAEKILNPKVRYRSFPFAYDALPKGPDPVWQKEQGSTQILHDASLIFDGLIAPNWPTDANGSAGHNYYMQAINKVFAIFDKASGTMVAGPIFFNNLFNGVLNNLPAVPGSEYNSGDPVVIYDEQANRWVACEMSIHGENDYVLVAVSETSDPRGSWYNYSFDVDDVPDYEKIAVWKNAYTMATNNGPGQDIFALERDVMLAGGSVPQIVGWNNPYRPFPDNEMHLVPPVDNDGPYAPDVDGKPAPALFITMNDDAVGGGADELWIYELKVDWGDVANATFDTVQTIPVPDFDSNFGNTSEAIPQPEQVRPLDAMPNLIMHRAQYRNFKPEKNYEVIMCCHTVDINNNDQSGIRWYELRKEGGEWYEYQSGTFAPDDGLYRWMGSIAMNGDGEIALGYSVSSTQEYPGIRYCGQSADATGTGLMNYDEQIIHTGYEVFGLGRWGDYWNMAVDPSDDHTFWFTAQYCDDFLSTKIASFDFLPPVFGANFSAEPKHVWKGNYARFTDRSTGSPTSWEWTFEGGDPESFIGIDPPLVQYKSSGDYDVTLEIVEGTDTNTIIRTDFIEVEQSPYCISRGDATDTWIKAIGLVYNGTHLSGSSGKLGYQDLSGILYNLEVGVQEEIRVYLGFSGSSSACYARWWMDLNHDNDFEDPDELVFAANRKRHTIKGTLTVPASALPGYTKMRVSLKKGSAPLPCETFLDGEVEDFTVFISNPAAPPPQPPVADFTADKTVVLVGDPVQFTDQSSNQPHTWIWEFPGGSTDDYTVQHPVVTYSSTGDFYVQLTATNDAGSDVELKPAYISVVEELPLLYCEPLSINNSKYYIDDIQIGAQPGATGPAPSGYHHYTNPFFTLVAGNYSVSLTPNSMNRKFSWKMWLDDNNDAIFDESSERLLSVNNVKGVVNENITIPAYIDPTRIRISMKLGGGGPLPCDDNFTGEVEDYNVTVSGADLVFLNENSKELIVEIYPNPVTFDELYINILRSKMPVTVQIYNMNGMLIDSFQSSETHIVLNTSSYPNGIMFVKISNRDTQLLRKLIKMK